MQILELEEKYSELKSDLSGQLSKRTKLLKISGYLGVALSNPKPQLIKPYIIEFIPDFIKSILDLEIRGLQPELLHSLSEQTQNLKALNLSDIDFAELEKAVEVLKDKIDLLNTWLNNKNASNKNLSADRQDSKVFFPLLEKIDDHLGTGYLESVSIVIKNGEQRFHISHADLENDEQLEKQVQLCFKKAIEYCKQYIKNIKIAHTVYLHFENRLGILTGNSLGAALTLSFIEAILKHYNSPIILNINNCVAITGGIDDNSNILSTSKAIVQTKLETVFFSDVQIFCVSKIDEIWAEEKLKELKIKYPNRDLKIIGLTDLNDLLDRRQIVGIRKQKLVVRSGKFIKKNWISAVATFLLAILFALLFVMDFDDNPNSYTLDGRKVYIKNKRGKTLWQKHWSATRDQIRDIRYSSNYIKIIDIDNDGINEVLFNAKFNEELTPEPVLTCCDFKGDKKWDYRFKDLVFSDRENLSDEYSINLIDTLNSGKDKKLFLTANNIQSFSAVILCLDIKTGKRLPGTFWVSGHTSATLIDVDNDKGKEIVGFGWDNGYENVVLFAKEIDTLTSVRKSIDSYTLKNFPLGEMINYARVPKNDYENYFNRHRNSGINFGSFCYSEYKKIFRFTIQLDDDNPFIGYSLIFNQNLYIKEILIGNDFRIARDTLVTHQKLKPPYTDTEEYKNIIMDNILYWKDGKWVNRKGEIKE